MLYFHYSSSICDLHIYSVSIFYGFLTFSFLSQFSSFYIQYTLLENLTNDAIAKPYVTKCSTIFLYLTKLYVTLSFAIASSVKYSEIRLNFYNTVISALNYLYAHLPLILFFLPQFISLALTPSLSSSWHLSINQCSCISTCTAVVVRSSTS